MAGGGQRAAALSAAEGRRYPAAMEPVIYTMVRAADWREAEALGEYRGGADDRRDGFLHFSTAGQLRASAAKHRAGEADLVLVQGLRMKHFS